MARVKICGITCLEDAEAAVEAGADALGFVFYPRSPRYVPPAEAMEICKRVPPFVWKVGVFVNMDWNVVDMIRKGCGLDVIQLHGDESPEYCLSFSSVRIFKACRVRNASDLEPLEAYHGIHAILVDGYHPDLWGGSGIQAPWKQLEGVSERFNLVLAGGLTPENVGKAIQSVRPYAVDVSSGVEREPGKKDHARMTQFIQAAREASTKNGNGNGRREYPPLRTKKDE